MTIVVIGSRYYIPVNNRFQEIPFAEAMDLYEKGEITNEEDLTNEYE